MTYKIGVDANNEHVHQEFGQIGHGMGPDGQGRSY